MQSVSEAPQTDEELYIELYLDPVLFIQQMLSDWFPDRVPWVHRGILAIMLHRLDFLFHYGELDKIQRHFTFTNQDGEEEQIFHLIDENGEPLAEPWMEIANHTEIMMPRGFSKTTLTNACTIFKICFRLNNFTVYISETASHAETQLDNIRQELAGNESIQALFGYLVPKQGSGFKLTADMIEFTNGFILAARGRGAQVRGLNRRGKRPDDIVLDDVESSESVQTPEQRAKVRNWFNSDVMLAFPRGCQHCTMTALGTLLHSEALLASLQVSPRWNTVVFGAIDPDGDPLWPEAMSLNEIEAERQEAALQGTLPVFYLDVFNQVRADDIAKFKRDFIVVEPADLSKVPYRSIALDPAISNKADADFSAIVVAGVHEQGWMQIIDEWHKRGATPQEQIEKYFEFAWKYVLNENEIAGKFGVESVAYQASLIHFMKQEMFRRKVFFEIEPITHKQKKDERVEGTLQPRYANGFIKHQRHFGDLETMLLDWPNGKKDLPDAEQMAVALLDDFAPIEGLGMTEVEEEEMEPLGEWRWC